MVADYAPERIDILLDENRIADAIAVTDREVSGHESPHDTSPPRLARSACHGDPDWTIGFALRLANPIMTEGRSNHYDLAVEWLAVAAQAHAIAGQERAMARVSGHIDRNPPPQAQAARSSRGSRTMTKKCR